VVSLLVVPLAIAGAFLDVAWLLHAAHALLEALMGPLEWLAALPSTVLESHAPAPGTVAAAVLGCLWLLAPRGFPLRSCGVLWIAPMFAFAPARPAPGEAWVDVLDVGNGLAVVVRTHAHALVYDAGPAWNTDIDSGNRIVVPFLRGEGVPRIDGLVVSHADDDHSGGAASVALSRSPAWLLSPLIAQDPLHGMAGATVRCHAGQRWRWDGVEFTVLHPPLAAHESGDRRKENDRGCVVRVATRGASLLLAADAEARSEAEMVARDAQALASDVLLVPHHGSKTSSTPRFLAAVQPRVGILSVGHRNRFGHPHPAVVQRYLDRGIALRRTDEEGALRVALPAGGEAPGITGQEAACRYWSERPACGSGAATPTSPPPATR
jgi:competence protein ComEC